MIVLVLTRTCLRTLVQIISYMVYSIGYLYILNHILESSGLLGREISCESVLLLFFSSWSNNSLGLYFNAVLSQCWWFNVLFQHHPLSLCCPSLLSPHIPPVTKQPCSSPGEPNAWLDSYVNDVSLSCNDRSTKQNHLTLLCIYASCTVKTLWLNQFACLKRNIIITQRELE